MLRGLAGTGVVRLLQPGSALAADEPPSAAGSAADGPVFNASGPDAEHYGSSEDYPVPGWLRGVWDGNPWPPKYRVGAFSHVRDIYKTRIVPRAASPWSFRRRAVEFGYRFRGRESSIADYLSRNPVTGLLVARDDEIFFEHYQYGRTDRDRLIAQSMTKSITSLLVGLAVADGAIRSIEDTAETYVADLRGSEYGRTPIRDFLHMASGVDFGEERDGGRDLDRLWIDMVLRRRPFAKGTAASIKQFNSRIAPPGTRFYYASIESDVLGLVVREAVGKSLSDYLHERVWSQIGTESDADWVLDAEGLEVRARLLQRGIARFCAPRASARA